MMNMMLGFGAGACASTESMSAGNPASINPAMRPGEQAI